MHRHRAESRRRAHKTSYQFSCHSFWCDYYHNNSSTAYCNCRPNGPDFSSVIAAGTIE
jgi:hypothetical protein